MNYFEPNFKPKNKNQLKKMMTQRDKIYYNIASNTKIEEQNLDKQNIFIKLTNQKCKNSYGQIYIIIKNKNKKQKNKTI